MYIMKEEIARAFEVDAETKARWADMTYWNDHAGVVLEQVRFIRKGLEAVHSGLADKAKVLEGRAQDIWNAREFKGHLTGIEVTADYDILQNALSLVEQVAGKETAHKVNIASEGR